MDKEPMKILFAEDDPELARQTRGWLGEAGYETVWCATGADALKLSLNPIFDIVIMDVGLPGMDGFEIVERMRGNAIRTPVLFLTARESVTDRVHGLKVGGDDYLTKPFAHPELLARIEALHRRATNSLATATTKAGWRLDPARRRVQVRDITVDLQPREWMLLELFMANEGRVMNKKFLLEKVWDLHFDPGTNVVDVMVCRLRHKIDEPDRPSHIQTLRGKGYVFQATI